MAVVPFIQNEQRLDPLAPDRQRAPDIGEAGRTVAGAVHRLGGTVAQAAETEEQIDTIYAEARAKKLDNDYQAFERDILYGDDGYYKKFNADALNARDPTQQAINERVGSLLEQTQDWRERAMLENVLTRRTQETFNGIARYSQGQAVAFGKSQSAARIENAQEGYAVSYATDPEQAKAHRHTVIAEVRALADLEGMQDAAILEEREEAALSSMHAKYIRSAMLGDAVQAAAYMEEFRHEIEPEQQITLDSQMQPLLVDHDARMFAAEAQSVGAPTSAPIVVNREGAAPGSPTTGGNVDQVFANMVGDMTPGPGRRRGAEGGTDPNTGRFLTSPAGAIGPAQVMPGTAKEMAAELGMEWDEKRYKSDFAYNMRLGRGYFAKMLKYYGGNVAFAVAAYNAGPGNVNKALKYGAEWRDHLPGETQKYLKNVLGDNMAGVAVSGPSAEVAAAQSLQVQLEWAETAIRERLAGKPPLYIEQVVDRTKARIRADHADKVQAVRAEEDGKWEQALERAFALGDGFTDITQVPGYNNLPVDRRMQLDNWAQQNRNRLLTESAPETDHEFYTNLSDLYANDQKGFLAVPPEQARAKLDDEDYERYVGWRQKALTPDKGEDERVTVSTIRTVASTALAAAGLTTTGKSRTAQQEIMRRRGQFETAMQRWAEHYQRTNDKWPDDEAIRKQADKMLIEMTWEGNSIWGTRESGFAFEAPADEIARGGSARVVVPEEIAARIRKSVPGISDGELRRLYVKHKGERW